MRPRHVVTTAAASLISGLGTFTIAAMVARLTNPTETGYFAQFILILNLINIFFNLGIGQSATFNISSGRIAYRDILKSEFCFILIVCLMICLLLLSIDLSGAFEELWKLKVPPQIFYMACFAGIFLVIFGIAIGNLYGFMRYESANALNVARTATPLFAIAVVSIWYRQSNYFTTAYLVGLAVVVFAAMWMAIRQKSIETTTHFDSSARLSGLYGYGFLVYASNVLHYSSMRGLAFFIGVSAEPADVGYFAIALLLMEGALLVPNALGQVVFPASAKMNILTDSIDAVLRFNYLFGFVIFGFILLFGKLFVLRIMGARYFGVYTALLWMSPAFVLLTLPKVVSPILSGRGKPVYPLAAAACSLATSIVFGFYVIPHSPLKYAALNIDVIAAITIIITLYGYRMERGASLASCLAPRKSDIEYVRRLIQIVFGRRT